MLETPLVSVIIPLYNREDFISETLDSVISQSYSHWECIVVDDQSTDNSKENVSKYCNEDKRIKLLSRPYSMLKGANSCRNYGFLKSKGDFIQWLDSDDTIECGKLKNQLNELTKKPNLDVTICQSEYFPRNKRQRVNWNKLNSTDYVNDFIQKKVGWSTSAPLWTKSSIESLGLFDLRLSSSQDYDLHIRALLNNYNISFFNDKYVNSRIHDNQIRNMDSIKKAKSRVIICEKLLVDEYKNRLSKSSSDYLLADVFNALVSAFKVKDKAFIKLIKKGFEDHFIKSKYCLRYINLIAVGSVYLAVNKGEKILIWHRIQHRIWEN